MPTARSTSPPLQPWTPRPNPNPNERTRLLRSPQPSPLIKPVRPRSIRSIASHATHDSHSHSRQGSPDPSSASDISDRRVAADDRTSLVVPKPKRTLRSRLLFATIVVLLAVCVYASFVDDFMGDVEATISCGTCIALLAPLQALARIGDDAFVDLFVGFCTKLGIEDADVCAGAVGTQAPILAHDLRSITLASPAAKNFCTTIFGLCPLPNTIPHTVNVTERPAEALEDPHFRVAAATRHHRRAAARKKWTSRGREPFQIVHISDVHVDRQYTPGAATDCTKVICCRDYGPHTVGPQVKYPAGPFGHKKCDAPPALVESMFRAIDRFVPNRKFSIFTGDVVESAVWAVERPVVTNDLELWHQDMQPVSYPVIGNHDVAPVNAFPRSTSPSAHASDWVYELTARDWQKWIGHHAANQVRNRSGCYARVHPGTDLKIISLNTNYWYKQNFWLYDSDVPVWDPNGILSWLADELDLAEKAGQRAWIIGHMPFGKVDAMRDQSNYANQIFQRYHDTIAAHFYGHSHVDEFEIAYPDYDNRTAETANGIAYISGALTPTSGNPVFRVYDIDPDTYEVMDFVPYYANKTDPQFQVDPIWKPYYSARQSYNSYLEPPHPAEASLNATFWHRVTEVFERNETVFQLFNTRLSRGGKIEDCSGGLCRKNTICMLRSMRSESNCAVIKPGLSFKDQKRDTDAVTEPQRDEERDPQIWALDHPEERYTQSRQHDYFACEGPGLASMLRSLGSGIKMPSTAEEKGGWASTLGIARKKRRKTETRPDFGALSTSTVETDKAPLENAAPAEESDDDDDVGPMPMPAGADGPTAAKRRRTLKHEKLYLDHLPAADRYNRSLMHRDTLVHVAVTKTNFVLTASVDGILKFWKKRPVGVEFVKLYRTHLSPILAVPVSDDGKSCASLGADSGGRTAEGLEVKGSAKVFDVENFDMINILKLPYVPRAACWIHGRNEGRILLAISDFDSAAIRIYDGRGDGKPLHTLTALHRSSVHLMTYNTRYRTVISADVSGMIEYWSPDEPFGLPDHLEWTSKAQTGLYEFKKTKTTPIALTLSPTNDSFAILSLPDLRLTTFNFLTGRLHRAYDESLTAVQEMQQAGTSGVALDSMEFGRRLAVERELEKLSLDAVKEGIVGSSASIGQPVWDESGKFVLYPTLLGIKVVNTVTNKVARILGKDETVRFTNIALYQGETEKKGVTTIAMVTSENPLLQKKEEQEPTLFCTAWKRPRFYLFTREEPEDKDGERDIYNEKPTRDEMTIAAPATSAAGPLARRGVIHTTKGDIHIELYPEHVPKTVENFVGLSKKHYYDDVIFHRVIPKFMLQTGDPLGDGTGGESLWGSTFEDEFHPLLKHDRPYMLSMANAGPKTNGSQFFITTVPCPWLDNKHSVFGRATAGFDVIHAIENVRTDKGDKPLDEIKISSITLEG
ncbi:hypothetical protein B0A53_03203 [Rhodotorula sp. CCFEE 5036]|nr:hypothetical protein B0A53_03203 [Rhodotorula sp. CCFEE 5036]